MSVPKEAVEVVWQFFDALTEENKEGLRAVMQPGGDAALMYELFGEMALYAASAALRGPCVVRMTRALQLKDSIWLEGEQLHQDTRETMGHVVFKMKEGEGGWQVVEILPWHLEAVHYLAERPDPRSDNSIAIMMTSLGLQVSPEAKLDAVEQKLVETMQDEYYPVNTITRAVSLWRDFRSSSDTSAHEHLTWAAAVHRAMNLLCLLDEPKEKVALLYNVESQQLARAYNQLVGTLDVVYFDHRYSPIPDPNELLQQAQSAGITEAIPAVETQPLPQEEVTDEPMTND